MATGRPGAWMLHDEGQTSLKRIPLVPVYARRVGFMVGEPPLLDLAHLNQAHYASSSEQRTCLHVTRIPVLFGTGLDSEKSKLTIGSSTAILTSNPQATLSYIEHSGQALGAGQVDIDKLEFQMQQFGLSLLVPRQSDQTATGELRDSAKEKSQLAMWTASLQDGLEEAFGLMGEFIGLGEDAGGSLEINNDFGIVGSADMATLLAATNSGHLSKETFWSELQRRNVLSDSFDPSVEALRLESEESRRGSMNLD